MDFEDGLVDVRHLSYQVLENYFFEDVPEEPAESFLRLFSLGFMRSDKQNSKALSYVVLMLMDQTLWPIFSEMKPYVAHNKVNLHHLGPQNICFVQ